MLETYFNEQVYHATKCDYEINAPVEDIDLTRILKENRDVGEEYVVIMNDNSFMIFFAKKFAKRLSKFNIIKICDVYDDEEYGFFDPYTENNNFVFGKQIRSVGFTHAMIDSNDAFDEAISVISSLRECEEYMDEREQAAKIAKQNDTRPKREIKIITGK